MNNEYSHKYVTVFYIDIRKYTELSYRKESGIVVDFIKDYRQVVTNGLDSINKNNKVEILKIIDKVYIGDAVLIIVETYDNYESKIKDIRNIVEMSLIIREKMLNLLSTWKNKKSSSGERYSFFEKVNFGIGIAQGYILIKDNDYIGFALNHAAKIGDMHQLSKNGHIGIEEEIFHDLEIGRELFSNQLDLKKFIGHTKVGTYINYHTFEKVYGRPW